MNKDDIKKIYNEKINELKRHNKLYYEKSSPIITDKKYDILKKEIISFENQFSFLKNKYSPQNIVGYQPSKNFEKFKHKIPMLSLSNAFDIEDLKNFEKKIFNFLDLKI